MKVLWSDVREDYLRKDAEITELKEKVNAQAERISMLLEMLAEKDPLSQHNSSML